MKRKLLSTGVCLALGVTGNASALTVSITSVGYANQTDRAATGSISSNGTGSYSSIDTLFGAHWTVDALEYFSGMGPHVWAGTSLQGSYSYHFSLDSSEVAWGTYWDWNGNNDMAVLNIMSCTGFQTGDTCTTQPTYIQAGPTSNSPVWHGEISSTSASAVPLPASAWLMGSGLVGLASVTRRRKIRA